MKKARADSAFQHAPPEKRQKVGFDEGVAVVVKLEEYSSSATLTLLCYGSPITLLGSVFFLAGHRGTTQKRLTNITHMVHDTYVLTSERVARRVS